MRQRTGLNTLAMATAVAATLLSLGLSVVMASGTSEQRIHRVMLPLLMRHFNLAVELSDVRIHTRLADGTPLPGVLIVGVYTATNGRTYALQRVTDDTGYTQLPGSPQEVLIEAQYLVGFLPCPDSPPRILAPPGTTWVEFVACQTQPFSTSQPLTTSP